MDTTMGVTTDVELDTEELEAQRNTSMLKGVFEVLLFALLVIIGISAAHTTEYPTKNAFAVGTVDITLTDELVGDDISNLPGDEKITHLVNVTNTGEDCYIRCRSALTSTEGIKMLSEYTGSAPDKWVSAADGCLYYMGVVGANQSIVFDERICTPEAWRDLGIGKLESNLTIEAIQAANFTPDFEADAPWGDVEIEQATSSSNTIDEA